MNKTNLSFDGHCNLWCLKKDERISQISRAKQHLMKVPTHYCGLVPNKRVSYSFGNFVDIFKVVLAKNFVASKWGSTRDCVS